VFKKYKLAAAMLAAVTTGAQAVYVNTDRLGEVVILPYYNVNNSFTTNIAITNTTNLYKAVKVRFRDSNLSNDVLDFNVYLSPQDQWTASVRLNPTTGLANIITTDETCTYPSNTLLQAGVDFQDFYTAVDTNDTLEGYVEIIEMGVIADGTGDAVDGGLFAEISGTGAPADGAITTADGDRSIIAGLLHDDDGVPADCSVVADAWAAGNPAGGAVIDGFSPGTLTAGISTDATPAVPYGDNVNAGLVAPTGGLHGYAILINNETGAAYVEEGTHINSYSSVPQHYQSDDQDNYLLPSLASGDDGLVHMLDNTGEAVKTVDGDGAGGDIPLTYFDTGSLQDILPNPSIPSGANPLPIAIALAKTGVATPYFVNAAIDGATDIVLTMPMRKHGVWNGATLNDQTDGGEAACEPDTVDGFELFPGDLAGNECTNWSWDSNTNDDAIISLTYYDDEEQVFTPAAGAPGFSPVVIGTPTVTSLSREVNIIALQEENGASTSSVLGTPSDNVTTLTLAEGFSAGWASITFDASYDFSTADNAIDLLIDPGVSGDNANLTMLGVPAIGFTAMTADIGPASVGETVEHIVTIDR
jgi:hypothetical protein